MKFLIIKELVGAKPFSIIKYSVPRQEIRSKKAKKRTKDIPVTGRGSL
jgi:hypothetical protein